LRLVSRFEALIALNWLSDGLNRPPVEPFLTAAATGVETIGG
jgi:hypothetical protein